MRIIADLFAIFTLSFVAVTAVTTYGIPIPEAVAGGFLIGIATCILSLD